jgi:hypothetical protein
VNPKQLSEKNERAAALGRRIVVQDRVCRVEPPPTAFVTIPPPCCSCRRITSLYSVDSLDQLQLLRQRRRSIPFATEETMRAALSALGRLLEDFDAPGNHYDDDTLNRIRDCGKDIQSQFTFFIYCSLLILAWSLGVICLYRACLKVRLDGAPIYEAQFWCVTGVIHLFALLISVLYLFPSPCPEAVSISVNTDCIRHCHTHRQLGGAVVLLQGLFSLYWFTSALARYQMARRLSSSSSSAAHLDSDYMETGIFSKVPNRDDDDIGGDMELTESTEEQY